jgi:phosphoribosyl-ATP pyrophosphohydrolase/phosphoribosyl-AMP cyclohydrolase
LPIDLSKLSFDSSGLIPAIVQDAENGEVLMMAWMNEEAIRRTVETGLTHFYSRSRGKLWQKGETSGHVQRVREILYDCDADCLLVKAEQTVAACHTGHRSCFHNTLDGEVKGEALFDADEIYAKGDAHTIIDRLFAVIMDRKNSLREDSYTCRLLSDNTGMLGGKVMEEAAELVEAAEGRDEGAITREAADLVYHALVLMGKADVSPGQVKQELARRFGTGGLEEKAKRK